MRISGQIPLNFFSMRLKANGRAGFSHSPVVDFVPKPGKPIGRNRRSQPEDRKITANETRVDLLENRSSLSTSFRRFQQLPLQENLRQRIQRPPVPPQHLQHGQLQQTRRLLQRKLLQCNPPDQMLLPFVEHLHAVLHVMNEDHHVIEALDRVVRHLATKHLPPQQRRRTTRLHRKPHTPSQQPFRVLPVERHLRSSSCLISSCLLHNLRRQFRFRSRSCSPHRRQYHQSCTHRAPPPIFAAAFVPAPHPTARALRRLRPPACFPRGAGNSASCPAHPRQ